EFDRHDRCSRRSIYPVSAGPATCRQAHTLSGLIGHVLCLCSLLLHRHAGLKALLVAVNRGNRQNTTAALVADDAVPLRHVTLDVDAVPRFRMANIVDRHIIVLAPEEWCRTEGRRHAYHVESGDLSLALGYHPVLDADAFA